MIHSSAIAALMARMIDRPLETFSVAFRQRAFSELDYARQVVTAIHAILAIAKLTFPVGADKLFSTKLVFAALAGLAGLASAASKPAP